MSKPRDLKIARGFSLPPQAVTQTFAIMARRGAGKTTTSGVMVEEMVKAGLPTCVVDPIGVWYGLRSSADGRSPGLPVVILGGEHGDAPLLPTAGAVVAEMLVDNPFPVVLDPLRRLRRRLRGKAPSATHGEVMAPTSPPAVLTLADRVVESLGEIGPATMPEVLAHLGGPVPPDPTVDVDADAFSAMSLHIATVFDERTVRTDEKRRFDGQVWSVWSLA